MRHHQTIAARPRRIEFTDSLFLSLCEMNCRRTRYVFICAVRAVEESLHIASVCFGQEPAGDGENEENFIPIIGFIIEATCFSYKIYMCLSVRGSGSREVGRPFQG